MVQINPDNLVLCRDGKVRLAGFCISECNDASSGLGFKPVAGYTALEQYDNSHIICPATDIYAFQPVFIVLWSEPILPKHRQGKLLMIS